MNRNRQLFTTRKERPVVAAIKNAWKSLTIWFNAVAAALLGMIDTLKDNLPFAQSYLTPDMLKYAAIVIVVANVLLRFRTKSSLADK